MQEISEHFALHFPTAKVYFLQIFHCVYKPFSVFSYLCLPTPVTFSISSSFPGFRMHIWIRVLSGKDHIRGDFFLSGDFQAKSTELLKKGLILFSQLPDCRFRKSAPFLFFLRLQLF